MSRFYFILFSLLVTFTLLGEDNIQDFSYGKVNWTKKTITVTGSGAPTLNSKNVSKARLNAERAAKLDAYRNVLEVVKGIKIKSSLTFEKEMEGDKTIATQIEGIVQGAVVKGKKYYDDGGVDLILEVPIDGILPVEKFVKTDVAGLKSGKTQKYSNLIIDVTNLKFEKVLLPEIKNESGVLLYSINSVDKDILKKTGIVSYMKTLDDAKKAVTGESLIITAKSVDLTDNGIIILSDADAKKLIENDIDLSFLTQGKVIIITK